MCALSINDEPPPEPRKTPTTEGRPGTGSTTETSRPAARSHDATNAAIAPSPETDGTRSGFTEGIATRSQINSCRSSSSVHAKRMQTIEKKQPAASGEQIKFEPSDVLKQVVISTLAVAPDASSIVYVRRTVEDGKYARRLWRTTFEGGAPEQLTSAKASDTRPRFSPDGRSLVFISDRSGKPQAWVMSLTGGEPRQVTDLPSGVGAADWSPDGKQLLLLAASGEKRFIVGKEDDPTARRIRDYTWRFDGVGIRDEFTSAYHRRGRREAEGSHRPDLQRRRRRVVARRNPNRLHCRPERNRRPRGAWRRLDDLDRTRRAQKDGRPRRHCLQPGLGALEAHRISRCQQPPTGGMVRRRAPRIRRAKGAPARRRPEPQHPGHQLRRLPGRRNLRPATSDLGRREACARAGLSSRLQPPVPLRDRWHR